MSVDSEVGSMIRKIDELCHLGKWLEIQQLVEPLLVDGRHEVVLAWIVMSRCVKQHIPNFVEYCTQIRDRFSREIGEERTKNIFKNMMIS